MVHLRSPLTGSLPPTRFSNERRAGPATPSLGIGASAHHDLSHGDRTRPPKRMRQSQTSLASGKLPAAVLRACGDGPGGKGQPAVGFKEFKEQRVACIRAIGSYDQYGGVLARFASVWMASHGYRPEEPLPGMFYNDPAKVPVEQCRGEICVAVDPEIAAEGEVEVKSIGPATVGYALYRGPYGDYDGTCLKLYSRIRQMGYRAAGPPMEINLSGPAKTPAADLLTEICVPVELTRDISSD